MRVTRSIADALLRQRGNLLLWLPCAFGGGIALYFALAREPGRAELLFAVALALFLALLARHLPESVAPLASGAAVLALGFLWAMLRAHQVSAPVLSWYYNGPVEGRIIALDRSASNAPRLTLDQITTEGPRLERVRISLHGSEPLPPLLPGARIAVEARLSPPGGPVEPGGFDFQRHAWFAQLGGVGYTRAQVELLAPPQGFWLGRARLHLSRAIQARISGPAGAVATAITTGDRSALPEEVTQSLRHSNLSHLLAISGLHMGLLTGVVFTGLRLLIALISPLALRVDGKKIASSGAILAGAVYLALSGASVATERAYIMVLVFFGAVFLDRRALTLRGVALAALIVLLLRPEALMGPGFQMSFAATTALVVIFGQMRGWSARHPVLGVLMSSMIAGTATAPFAAAHFNITAAYGVLANMLSVPLMGAVVMPAFVIALPATLIGAESLPLLAAELGLRWILAVAEFVSALPGAVYYLPAPPGWAIPAVTLGGLWFVLWHGRARWAGLVPLCAAAAFWTSAPRPDLLIAHTGGIAGLMGPEGRALTKPRGDGFSAEIWLENDGAPVAQAEAAARPPWRFDKQQRRAELGPLALLMVTGERASAQVGGCDGADIFITNTWDRAERPCLAFSKITLARSGAVGISLVDGAPHIQTARDLQGNRLWNTEAFRARAGLSELARAALRLQ